MRMVGIWLVVLGYAIAYVGYQNLRGYTIGFLSALNLAPLPQLAAGGDLNLNPINVAGVVGGFAGGVLGGQLPGPAAGQAAAQLIAPPGKYPPGFPLPGQDSVSGIATGAALSVVGQNVSNALGKITGSTSGKIA